MVLSILSVFNDLFFYVCETETKKRRKIGMHVCARGWRSGGWGDFHVTHAHNACVRPPPHTHTCAHTHMHVCALTHTHTHTPHIPPSLHSLTLISHKQWTHTWHHNHTTVTHTHTQCESHCRSVFVILPVSAEVCRETVNIWHQQWNYFLFLVLYVTVRFCL